MRKDNLVFFSLNGGHLSKLIVLSGGLTMGALLFDLTLKFELFSLGLFGSSLATAWSSFS